MPTRMTVSLALLVSVCAACRKNPPPPPVPTTTTVGQNLHVEGMPGVPNVDIHPLGDAGGMHIQIGGAQVDLPSGPPVPIPSENGN